MKRKAHFQRTLASQSSYEKFGRKSKRELFLDEMNAVVPWGALLSLVEPYYPKVGNGRRPVGLEIMLRTYFVQQWFNLSDPGVEEALYDSASLRRFVGVDLGLAAAPDETTKRDGAPVRVSRSRFNDSGSLPPPKSICISCGPSLPSRNGTSST
jgi:hypothetical protein